MELPSMQEERREEEYDALSLDVPIPPPSAADEEKFKQLLIWLNTTMVVVRDNYVDGQRQPIRNLFSNLVLFSDLIKRFIRLRKEGKMISTMTLENMKTIISEMTNEYAQIPRDQGVIRVGLDPYNIFFTKRWKPMISNLLRQHEQDDFLTYFLEKFGSYYDKYISFDSKVLENFKTLFSEINKTNDAIANDLYETFYKNRIKYSNWYTVNLAGGRKLSRRRKSNPKSKSKSKSKSKHKHKRRSHKKSSYRRQRH
jgi:hypothetical protein